MGIFQNKIDNTGRFLKTGLESILRNAPGEDISEKLNSVKEKVVAEGIPSSQGYKFTLQYNPHPTSLEVIFDFQGNSGGYDTQGLQNAASALRKHWMQPEPQKFRFTYKHYEFWVQDNQVHVKLSQDSKLSMGEFNQYLGNCEKIFNYLIGRGVPKTNKQSGQSILKSTASPQAIDGLYDIISKKLQIEGLELGKRLELDYEGRKIDVFLGGIDQIQLHAQIEISATDDQVTTYKSISIEPHFNNIGTHCATCTENTSQADAPTIHALAKKTIAAYEKLVERFPNIKKN